MTLQQFDERLFIKDQDLKPLHQCDTNCFSLPIKFCDKVIHCKMCVYPQ